MGTQTTNSSLGHHRTARSTSRRPTAGVKFVLTKDLQTHPLNQSVYGIDDVTDLVQDIRSRGIVEPLVVTPSLIVISGHRRLRAAQLLAVSRVPTRVISDEPTIELLVTFNRYRRKTWSQVYRECAALLPSARARAMERQRAARRERGKANSPTTLGPKSRRAAIRAVDEVALLVGLKREGIRRLLFIHDAQCAGRLPKHIVEYLDSGVWTLHRAFLEAKRAIRDEGRMSSGDGTWLRSFDLWVFKHRDRRWNVEGDAAEEGCRGSHPPQVFANLIHHFTKPGDSVADVMAGEGTVQRVCEAMGRVCTSLDLTPRRPFIRGNDARTVPLDLLDARFDLIVLDPPYGSTMKYSDNQQDLSVRCDLADYLGTLEACILAWLPHMRPTGRFAVFMGNEERNGVCEDRIWQTGAMLGRYLRIVRRIWVPHGLTVRTGIRAARAVHGHWLATRQCELFVCSRRE